MSSGCFYGLDGKVKECDVMMWFYSGGVIPCGLFEEILGVLK